MIIIFIHCLTAIINSYIFLISTDLPQVTFLMTAKSWRVDDRENSPPYDIIQGVIGEVAQK